MRIFEMKIKRIKDKYTIRESKEPEGRKTHILYHETETPHGCNYQRVFMGTLQACRKEKEKRENAKKKKRVRYV